MHNRFVDIRIANLKKKARPLRKSKIVSIDKSASGSPSRQITETIYRSINQLHQAHSVNLEGKELSIGLIRMANINPLIQVAKSLVNMPAPEGVMIHYCVYHSQFPLLQRSKLEALLDCALTRHSEKDWIKHSGIVEKIKLYKEKQHIFVVLATAVAEVGRDHDYDWAVVEPSSMRSIIQLAGRVQRHRKREPYTANIHILDQNFKGLKSESPCFKNPGFESKELSYFSNNLNDLIEEGELDEISAVFRIKTPLQLDITQEIPPRFKSFNGLEHFAQTIRLKGSNIQNDHASLWWQNEATWCGELQRLQPFRRSSVNDDFNIVFSREGKAVWQKKQPKTYPAEFNNTDDISKKSKPVELGKGVEWWSDFDLKQEIYSLAETLNLDEKTVLRKFTHVSLRQLKDNAMPWQSHPQLGVYRNLVEEGSLDD